MKQRFSSHTTLIELTLALLFLMIASVTILGLFTTAHGMSRDAGSLTAAVQLAQDCASVLAASDDPVAALTEMGYAADEHGALSLHTKGDLQVLVMLEREQTGVGEMLEGTISVYRAGEALTDWPVSRYFNKEVIHP